MVGRILGVLGVPLLLVGLIWLGAVIYFQQTGANIGSADIATWFVLVPLAAVGVWFIGKAIYARSQGPATPAEVAGEGKNAAPATRDESLSLYLSILRAEINTAAGESAADLIKGIRKDKIKPAFAEHLIDDMGMPVKAVYCTFLDSDEHLAWVEQWLQAAGNPNTEDAPKGARLLALLQGPLQRTLDALADMPAPSEDIDAMAGAVRQAAQEPHRRPLVTKVFASPAWQNMIEAYVRAQVKKVAGFACGLVRSDAAHPELQADSLRVADAFCRASTDDYAKSILLIVACDSLTAQADVDTLTAQGQLFTSANLGGVVPGEAAAVILAVPAALAPAEPPALAGLHRATFGARQKPVDGGGRTDAALLQQLTGGALANAAQERAAIAAVISDCDQRSPWFNETAMLVSTTFEELDAVADHLAVGSALGSTGCAGSTLALALAAQAVAIDNKPVLVTNVADSRARSVAILSPWQAPSATSDNPAPPNPS